MNGLFNTRALSRLLRNCAFGFALVAVAAVSPAQAQLYGDGSDGDVTIAGTVNLVANMNYNNLTVPAGTVLETHGFDVRVNGTLINGGTIRDNFSGGNGGNGGNFGNGGGSSSGQSGSSGGSGLTGAVGTGNGGDGGGGGGGGGGAWDSNEPLTASGGRGGNGGAGGKGGGKVHIYAREIINTGLISAAGLPGSNGGSGLQGQYKTYTEALVINRDIAGGGGGGGGGGEGGDGGSVLLVHAIPTLVGSISANGAGGGSGGGGASGRNTQYNAGGSTTEYPGGGGGGFDANGGGGGRGEISSVASGAGGSGQGGLVGAPGSITLTLSTICYIDADNDGFGDAGDPGSDVAGGCGPGFSDNNLDCDDGDAQVNPDAVEVCNGIDDDCNSLIDDGLVFQTWYVDADGDLFGASGTDSTDCVQPAGYVDNNLDCDDGDPQVNPDAVEVCNGIDDDCNSLIDDGLVFQTWYVDADDDLFGASGTDSTDCVQPAGYVDNDADCDDIDAAVNPNAAEVCGNGVDDNCDGTIDEGCCPITATGDLDGGGTLTSADIIAMVNFVFKGGATPQPCQAIADVNCDGVVTSSDIILMVNHVFKGGVAPCDVCTLVPGTWTCP